jgi:hypothetical protein
MNERDLERLYDCMVLLTRTLGQLRGELSPRELVALRIGLRASHVEEALMAGDADRALAHFRAALRLMVQLHNTARPSPDALTRAP